MANFFDKAKQKAQDGAKDSKKPKLRLTAKHDKPIFDAIKRQAFLKKEMDKLKAESDILDGTIKELAIKKWAERYDQTGINPETVMIEMREKDGDISSDLAQFMFIVQDRYIKLSKEDAERLAKQYGDDVISDQTTYKFNSEMVEKYGEIIAELIDNCDKIADGDKESIIEADNSLKVKKETIKRFGTLAKQYNTNVLAIVNDLRPIIGTKNTAVIQQSAATVATASVAVTPDAPVEEKKKGLSALRGKGKKKED